MNQAVQGALQRGGSAIGPGPERVLILRLFVMNDPFTLAERLELTAELTALAGELGSIEVAWDAGFHRPGALFELGDIGGAERALAEVERLAGELRQPFYTWWLHMEGRNKARNPRRSGLASLRRRSHLHLPSSRLQSMGRCSNITTRGRGG